MDHFIKEVEIKNFKSIRELKLSGFKRINLFIGRPNVGKSNLLEALSLFALPIYWSNNEKLTDLIRFKRGRELFYDGNFDEECYIRFVSIFCTFNCLIGLNKSDNSFTLNIDEYFKTEDQDYRQIAVRYYEIEGINYSLLHEGSTGHYDQTVKPYYFKKDIFENVLGYSFLLPPFGNNLYDVIEFDNELRKTFAHWFRQYGLRLVIDTASQTLKVQRDKGDEVFQLPYSSVADTLQRIIFYKTAVASNENSVLLFEEPEAHAYPPYISEFTWEVIKSKTNQTFIITHSPLIVEQFLADALDDLAIFMVDFRDGQTAVKCLSSEEVNEVYRYGMDLFFNGEAYLD